MNSLRRTALRRRLILGETAPPNVTTSGKPRMDAADLYHRFFLQEGRIFLI